MAPAEGILLNTAGAPAKTLEWYRAMIHLGRVQAWDRQRVDAMPAGRQVPRRFAVYVQMSAVR